MHATKSIMVVLGVAVLGWFTGSAGGQTQEEEWDGVVRGLSAADPAVRQEAIRLATTLPPPAVAAVGHLLGSKEAGVAEAARRALWRVAHHRSLESAAELRALTARALLSLARAEGGLAGRVRAEVLRMLSVVADDAETLGGLEGLLGDAEVAEAAIFALERITHPEAERILLRRLEAHLAVLKAGENRGGVPSDALAAAVYARTLAARRTRAAAPLLRDLAVIGTKEDAGAARASLARLGDPAAIPLLEDALERGEPGAAADLALVLERCGPAVLGEEDVLRLCRLLLAASEPAARLAGVRGLADLLGGRARDDLLAALADPAPPVAMTAEKALEGLSGTDLPQALWSAYRAAGPTVQWRLLRILARRQDPGAPAEVLGAAQRAAGPLQVTALDLLGESDETDSLVVLLHLLSGPEGGAAKSTAARSLARRADRLARRRGPEERSAAREILHVLLDRAEEPSVLAKALRTLPLVVNPDSLTHVERHAGDPEQRTGVALARLAVARTLQVDEPGRARALFTQVFRARPGRRAREEAAAGLRSLGADIGDLARQDGCVTGWWVIGSFPATAKEDIAQHPFGTAEPDTSAAFSVRGEEVRWTKIESDDPDGMVDLRFLKPDNEATAYAACVVRLAEDSPEVPARIMIGSDDGVAVWVNGVLRHQNYTFRGATPDEDQVQVTLRPGANRLLLKICQGGGDWGFCLRITDREGRPLEFERSP